MFLLLLLLPVLHLAAQQPEAGAIISKTRDLTVTGSLSATVSLTITEKSGSIRHRTIAMQTKSLADGTEKRLIKFTEPADVKGTAMLIIDNRDKADEMWIYLPALKKTRRIVSTERGKSFMSSEFSNADFSSPALEDFTNRHLAGSGNNNTWIIESTPSDKEKAAEYGFARKVSYISVSNWTIQKMEFYNPDNILFKTIEIRAVQPGEKGTYIIKDMIARNLLNGRSSEISFSSIQMNQNINESVFTVQNLEK
jgi:hypothetical protein